MIYVPFTLMIKSKTKIELQTNKKMYHFSKWNIFFQLSHFDHNKFETNYESFMIKTKRKYFTSLLRTSSSFHI